MHIVWSRSERYHDSHRDVSFFIQKINYKRTARLIIYHCYDYEYYRDNCTGNTHYRTENYNSRELRVVSVRYPRTCPIALQLPTERVDVIIVDNQSYHDTVQLSLTILFTTLRSLCLPIKFWDSIPDRYPSIYFALNVHYEN